MDTARAGDAQPDGSVGDDDTGIASPDTPTVCGNDERVLNERCVPCPFDTSNDAGDEVTEMNTVCDAVMEGCQAFITVGQTTEVIGIEFSIWRDSETLISGCDSDANLDPAERSRWAALLAELGEDDITSPSLTVQWKAQVHVIPRRGRFEITSSRPGVVQIQVGIIDRTIEQRIGLSMQQGERVITLSYPANALDEGVELVLTPL